MIRGKRDPTPIEIALNDALTAIPRVESVELIGGVGVYVVLPNDDLPKRNVTGIVKEFNKSFPDERVELRFKTRKK